jgi:anti-sigma regulatory factor (Ser/Thr protein kinase)
VTLEVGTKLLLYTDGLVERRDRAIDAGIDALAERLAAAKESTHELPAALVQALVPDGSDDDVAVLVACVPDEPRDAIAILQVAAEPPAVPRARDFLGETLRRWDVPKALITDALLLVSELVTNAILHGRPPIELRVRRTRAHVLLEVDDGATVLPRKLRPTPDDEHGRGLQLAAMLSDRWGTRPLRDGKSVWCLLSLSRY